MKEIRLDWEGYFRQFSLQHGGSPVPFKGLLLFRDGWCYSTNPDHAGPEYAPPEEANLRRVYKSAYWHSLRTLVRRELHAVGAQLTMVATMQNRYSLPLQAVVSYRNENDERVIERGDLETRPIEQEFEWLREQLLECDKMINDLALNRRLV